MKASLLFLTSGRSVPSSRFRVRAFVPQLRRDGFRVRVVPCVPNKYAHKLWTPAKLVSRLTAVLRAPFHDLIFLERELLPHFTPLFERIAAALNRCVHFDFDDAIHLKYHDPERNPLVKVLRLARGVTAGNEWLAAYARRFTDRVAVVPTAIDTDRFSPPGAGDVPLVWTGTSSNLPFLADIAPALREVPGARILVVCDRPPPDLGIPTEFVRWSARTEVDAVRRGRVGLMPLPDKKWAQGKCGFKLLQYMACGVPSVASPVGVNPEILDDGRCGLLASSRDDWAQALTRLLADARLQKDLSARARARVAEHYSVRSVYPRLREALRTTLTSA
ncbi:MAG: glycosyltransferase family 4 protein [Planctomycetota bacterium]